MGDYENAIARILREQQQKDGMPSYRQLAESTGLSKPTIERIFNARRAAVMQVSYLRLICDQLGLKLGEVLTEADASTSS